MSTAASASCRKEYSARVRALHDELGMGPEYYQRRLPLYFEPSDLVTGDSDPNGIEIRLESETAKRWRDMKQAAAQDGITLLLEFGYRSLDQQAALIRDHLAKGQSLTDVLALLAAPGYSQHHTGRAIDIGCPDCYPTFAKSDFGNTAAFRWLQKNAKRFGFALSYPSDNPYGLTFEPWHWYLWDVGT